MWFRMETSCEYCSTSDDRGSKSCVSIPSDVFVPLLRRRIFGGPIFQFNASAQREQMPGMACCPTSGRIFQHRLHFSPSAFSKTTLTPATSGNLKVSVGAGSSASEIEDVMQTSLNCTERKTARSSESSICTTGAASRLAPMTLFWR